MSIVPVGTAVGKAFVAYAITQSEPSFLKKWTARLGGAALDAFLPTLIAQIGTEDKKPSNQKEESSGFYHTLVRKAKLFFLNSIHQLFVDNRAAYLDILNEKSEVGPILNIIQKMSPAFAEIVQQKGGFDPETSVKLQELIECLLLRTLSGIATNLYRGEKLPLGDLIFSLLDQCVTQIGVEFAEIDKIKSLRERGRGVEIQRELETIEAQLQEKEDNFLDVSRNIRKHSLLERKKQLIAEREAFVKESDFSRLSQLILDKFLPHDFALQKSLDSAKEKFLVAPLNQYLYHFYVGTRGESLNTDKERLNALLKSDETTAQVTTLCQTTSTMIREKLSTMLGDEALISEQALDFLKDYPLMNFIKESDLAPLVQGVTRVVKSPSVEFGSKVVQKFLEQTLLNGVVNLLEKVPQEKRQNPQEILAGALDLLIGKFNEILPNPLEKIAQIHERAARLPLDKQKGYIEKRAARVVAPAVNTFLEIFFRDLEKKLPFPKGLQKESSIVIKDLLNRYTARAFLASHTWLGNTMVERKKLTSVFRSKNPMVLIKKTNEILPPAIAFVLREQEETVLNEILGQVAPLVKDAPSELFRSMTTNLIRYLGAARGGNPEILFSFIAKMTEPFLLKAANNGIKKLKDLEARNAKENNPQSVMESLTIEGIQLFVKHFYRLKAAKEDVLDDGKKINYETVAEAFALEGNLAKATRKAILKDKATKEDVLAYDEFFKKMAKEILSLVNINENSLEPVPSFFRHEAWKALETNLAPIIVEQVLTMGYDTHMLNQVFIALCKNIKGDEDEAPPAPTSKTAPIAKKFTDPFQKKFEEEIVEFTKALVELQPNSIGASVVAGFLGIQKIGDFVGNIVGQTLREQFRNPDTMGKVSLLKHVDTLSKLMIDVFEEEDAIKNFFPLPEQKEEVEKKKEEEKVNIARNVPRALKEVLKDKLDLRLEEKVEELERDWEKWINSFESTLAKKLLYVLKLFVKVCFFAWCWTLAAALSFIVRKVTEIYINYVARKRTQDLDLPHANLFFEGAEKLMA